MSGDTAVTGHVLFRLGGRRLATPLADVREVLRLGSVDPLPGMPAPLAGVMLVRGVPLPVLDARDGQVDGRGDVLVVSRADQACGVVVDAVLAVRGEGELAADAGPVPAGLPRYVSAVLRDGDTPVLLVDLDVLVGWHERVA